MLVNYSVLLVELIMGVIRHNSIISVWAAILDFDQSFSLITIGGKKRKSVKDMLIDEFKLHLWTTAFASIVGWIFVSGASITVHHDVIVNHFTYMVPYYGTYIAVFKFCGLAFLIGQRFKYLNESILASANEGNLKSDHLLITKVRMTFGNSDKLP
ncbi:hypothetical protein QAD02_016746 [Eretmocerus hayati]|uniref:Uncharacterized protein n=1 Tax=Eretmocerus hayati TaxID=131215 RepID=A0ACC2PEF9_9HYME|nr:hypothetical protein QAD02_016746 [Eretmocerus hayati]